MASEKNRSADFFDDSAFDPVSTAIGTADSRNADALSSRKKTVAPPKKKAGFYLSIDMLDRFNRKFHELMLAGVNVDNKSTFVEALLTYALDELDQGDDGGVLKTLGPSDDRN